MKGSQKFQLKSRRLTARMLEGCFSISAVNSTVSIGSTFELIELENLKSPLSFELVSATFYRLKFDKVRQSWSDWDFSEVFSLKFQPFRDA